MRYRLTPLDEWPRHQIGATFDMLASDSPHWSDGYYFTMGSPDGEVALFSGLRLYANNDVMDAFACAGWGGRQYNARFSRRLRPRIDDLDCGAMAVEVVEPLRVMRTRCNDNPYGVTFDLMWTGAAPPYNEAHVLQVVNGRVVADRSNYDQTCRVDGWLEAGGRRWDVEDWTGVRDHSWGIGATGGPRSRAAAPPPRDQRPRPFALRMWCVFRLPSRVVWWQMHRDADGELTMFESHVDGAGPGAGSGDGAYAGVDESLDALDGPHRLRRATVVLQRPGGGADRFAIEAISQPVYLEGGGYWSGFDDNQGRGVYRGDDHHEGETWDLVGPDDVADPKGRARLRPERWAEQWGRCTNLDDPAESGTGHLECVIA